MTFSMIERSDVNAEVGSSGYLSNRSRSLLDRRRLSISVLHGGAERMHGRLLLLISEEARTRGWNVNVEISRNSIGYLEI